MARTFSHQKKHRHNQQPPRASWSSSTHATIKRGKYADLADRVREYRLDMVKRQKDQANDKRQKRPVSD